MGQLEVTLVWKQRFKDDCSASPGDFRTLAQTVCSAEMYLNSAAQLLPKALLTLSPSRDVNHWELILIGMP